MLLRLIILFTVVPLFELWLLIELGGAIGTWPTIILVLGTGILGAGLAKTQGLVLYRKIRVNLNQGRMPTQELISGLCVLTGGILLIAPGLLTDITGVLLLLPFIQSWVAELIRRWLRKKFKLGDFYINHMTWDRESVEDDES